MDGVLGRLATALGPGVTGVVERVAAELAAAEEARADWGADELFVDEDDFLADDDGRVMRRRERELSAWAVFFHK